MSASEQPHLAPLGGEGWATWRDAVLRGAGFPAETALALTDSKLAEAADMAVDDAGQRAAFLEEYRAAAERLSAAIRETARLPRFREAVGWQNPKLVKLCLDKAAAGEPRNVRGRNHEQTIASYLQRYGMKNDTIGFVGPVGWARWADDGPPLELHLGEGLLARRTVYFETWAIDAVARTLSADSALRPLLAPQLYAAHRLDGATLHVHGRAPVELTARESTLLALVNGARTVQEIAAELAGSEFPELGEQSTLLAALDELIARNLVRLDLIGTIETWPERSLRARLAQLPPVPARDRALGILQSLIDARDRVAEAAGDDVALEAALAELGDRFSAITGVAGERRPGENYAGRALVYEDAVRDARVTLGPALRDQLARPLCLLLDSARWLVAEIGQEYHRYLLGIYERRVGQLGSATVPLASVLSLATPQMYFNPRSLAGPCRQAVTEFQRRWAAILQIPPAATDVQLRSEELRDRVAELFPARPAPWATAIHHSPDFMLAATDEGAIARGEHLFVLGELHLSFNTMESRLFVEQHDDPASLLAAAESDLGARRIFGMAPKEGAARELADGTAVCAAVGSIHLLDHVSGGGLAAGADHPSRRPGGLPRGRRTVRPGPVGRLPGPAAQGAGRATGRPDRERLQAVGPRLAQSTGDDRPARPGPGVVDLPGRGGGLGGRTIRARTVPRRSTLVAAASAARAGVLHGAGRGQADVRRLQQPGLRQPAGEGDSPLGRRGRRLGDPDRDAARSIAAVAAGPGRPSVHLGTAHPRR